MSAVALDAKDIEKALNAFRKIPEKFERSMRLAMKKSVRDIGEHARRNHRFTSRTGQLERAVQDRVILDPLSGVVFLNTREAPYAGYVHSGTKPHAIFPKRRKALRWVSGDSFVFAKNALHPGTDADPFLFDSLEEEKESIFKRFRGALEKATKEAQI